MCCYGFFLKKEGGTFTVFSRSEGGKKKADFSTVLGCDIGSLAFSFKIKPNKEYNTKLQPILII